jgi:hemoglobin
VNLDYHPMIAVYQRIALFFLCAVALCPPVYADTLYERLGGEKGVAQFVDQTIELTATDPVTKRSFDKVDLKKLKQKIAEHICAITGGPCKYSGDPMKVVHQGLDITEAEFYGMVEILRGTLNRAQVPEGAKNELLRILAPMKREIVSK